MVYECANDVSMSEVHAQFYSGIHLAAAIPVRDINSIPEERFVHGHAVRAQANAAGANIRYVRSFFGIAQPTLIGGLPLPGICPSSTDAHHCTRH